MRGRALRLGCVLFSVCNRICVPFGSVLGRQSLDPVEGADNLEDLINVPLNLGHTLNICTQ